MDKQETVDLENAKTDDQEFAEYMSKPENRREFRKALKRAREGKTNYEIVVLN